MPALRDLQFRMVRGVLDGESAAVLPWIVPGGLPAAARLDVYANNCRAGFRAAIESAYPVIAALAGPDCFSQLVRDYQRRHPSGSGNLFHAGQYFPDFLAGRYRGGEFGYFADVAVLEWACECVMVAAEGSALDTAGLSRIAPDDYRRIVLLLQPACRVIGSRWPVVSIWEAHQDSAGESRLAGIDLKGGGEYALVQRRAGRVRVVGLPAAEFAVLGAIANGNATLERISDLASTTNPPIDLPAALGRWAALGALAGFHLDGPSSPPMRITP